MVAATSTIELLFLPFLLLNLLLLAESRKILHGSRVFSGVDTSVDIVRPPLNRISVRPPADNEKSRVRMVVTQSIPVTASC